MNDTSRRTAFQALARHSRTVAILATLAVFLQFWLTLSAWFAAELPGLLGRWQKRLVLVPSVLCTLTGPSGQADTLRPQTPTLHAHLFEEPEEPFIGVFDLDLPQPASRGDRIRALPRAFRQVDERLLSYLVLRRTGAS